MSAEFESSSHLMSILPAYNRVFESQKNITMCYLISLFISLTNASLTTANDLTIVSK